MFFSQNAFYCSPVEVDKRLCVGNWLFNQDGAVWWPWQAVNCYSVQLLPILARWNLTGCYTTICDIMLWVGGWPRWLSCSSPSQNPRLLGSLEHSQSEMLKVLFLSHTHFHTESLHGCTLSRQLLSWGRKVTYPHCQSQSSHIPDNLSLQHSYRLTAHTRTHLIILWRSISPLLMNVSSYRGMMLHKTRDAFWLMQPPTVLFRL